MSKKRTCETCEKLNRFNGECRVLKKRTDGECWAWTDDEEWQMKAIKATVEYKKQKRERK